MKIDTYISGYYTNLGNIIFDNLFLFLGMKSDIGQNQREIITILFNANSQMPHGELHY